jgi:lambda repressor-like predicted transcriptional regulator
MEARTLKLIYSCCQSGDSLSQISEETGLTEDEVKETLWQVKGIPPKEVDIIFHMKQQGLGLEQISQEVGVELDVLKLFLPQVIEETVHALADRSPPTTTEETKEPDKPQPTKALPTPQYIPTHFYCCQKGTNKLHRVDLLSGDKTYYEVPSYLFKWGCQWSDLHGRGLLITGGGNPVVREVVKIDTLREWAVSSVPPMHTARCSHAVVYHSQHLYVLGGYSEDSLRECERYVCAESRWELLPVLPVAGAALSAVELENCLYALGGNNGLSFSDTVQKLSVDSLTWELIQLKLPQASGWTPCFKADTEVYLVSGGTLYSFTPSEVKPIKTVPQSFWCFSSYYSRGTLYYEDGRGISSCRGVN